MHETDAAPDGVNQIKGAAISYINTEANVALIGKQTIAAGKAALAFHGAIDDCEPIAVNLLRREELAFLKTKSGAHLTMNGVEAGERFSFVKTNFDAWHASDESVPAKTRRIESGERLDREILRLQFTSRYFPLDSCERACTRSSRMAEEGCNGRGVGFGGGVGTAGVLSFRRVPGSSSWLA